MRLTTVQDNNMQQHATNDTQCCVLLGKKFRSFDRGFTVKRFLIIYGSNLSYNRTQTVSVVLLSHIITNLIAITINVLESHDSTIALRSNGNQALVFSRGSRCNDSIRIQAFP